ncbi:GPP34 family phosphoprotein [Streptomyces sp. NPDC008001]|uniref:GOLPH3/VPS74 family protein n=1 Tax=Streptomyces sp. NPDC008001 TaxID=3364804 RepID=UPI0036E26689
MTPGPPVLTLPEELLLLSFDPVSGRRLCGGQALEYGVAGAVLAELELAGRVTEERGRVTVTNPVPPGDPLLAMALAALPPAGKGARGRGPRTVSWVRTASRHLEEPWLARLVKNGALRREKHRFLGVVPYYRHPVGPVDRTTETRQRFEEARRAGFAGPRSRVLAALASATGTARALYPGWDGRHDRSAMRRLRREEWTAWAVHRNVMRDRSDSSSGSGGGDGGGG